MSTPPAPHETAETVTIEERRTWLAYWQLVRVPAVFTAVADILLGFLVANGSFEPFIPFTAILVSSICLYWAGMVLNDVFDIHRDRIERPQRPIPSGRVSLRSAIVLSAVLIAVGLLAAASAGMQTLTVATLLTGAIFLYDGVLKKTILGPFAMGSCRFFNVMLGASLADTLWAAPQLPIAMGLGLYIVGVTWFARTEAVESRRGPLSFGIGIVNLALAWLAGLMLNAPGESSVPALILLGVVALTINARLFRALNDPSPKLVQFAVRLMLLSLITIDAALILFQTGDPIYAGVTLFLLAPATQLSRFIPMT